jgi:sterol desaturase/sphingolipid hydroxylase (fatty acid hydroxylase superfamily)
MDSMKRALAFALYPALVIAAAWAMAAALDRGVSSFWSVAAIQTAAVIIAIALEHALPFRPAWLRSHGDLRTDIAHLAITSNVAAAARWAVTVGSIALASRLSRVGPAGLAAWPTSWPLWAQVALITVLQGLLGYWVHRAHHGLPILWRLHAVHHSAPRVYWLNQTRVHPIESILDGLTLLPLVLLGAPERAMLVFTAFSGMHLTLQHANIDLRLGPLNWIVSLSELHRWHHSRERSEADANYGGVLLIWDIVFGTRRWPRDREPPADPGVNGLPGYPTGYLGQLASPFRAELWRPARSARGDIAQ